MKQRSALFAAVVLAACSNSSSGLVLTRVDSFSSDATCPAGGVKISVGKDTDADGTLADAEVTQTKEVCNGAAGATGPAGPTGGMGAAGDAGSAGATGDAGATAAASLVNTTALAAGDEHCASGGARLDFGLDDGTGGGLAGDGLLEPGEIRNSTFVCNGLAPSYPGSTTPPEGPAGAFTIQANGGSGTRGGSAGSLQVSLGGTLGGNAKLFSTGAVDAGVTVPQLTFVGGAAPMLVTADTALVTYASHDAAAEAGARFYQLADDQRVFSDDAGVVTAISVAAAATLTITGDVSSATISVPYDVQNAGTITTGRLNLKDSKGLNIYSGRFLSTSGSSIDLTGLPADADSSAGVGGSLGISVGGVVQSLGTIRTTGGTGEISAQPGTVSISSGASDCFIGGVIDTHGATGTFAGANGSSVNVECRSVSSSAAIIASGGDSAGAAGPTGSGGQITVVANQGALRNTGALTSLGGASHSSECTGEFCSGGRGGDLTLRTSGGAIFSNATLDASGGAAPRGGAGGQIEISSNGQDSNDSAASGSIHLSGDLRVNGADSEVSGGSAGTISITLNPSRVAHGEEIELLGYSEVDLTGGSGTTSGGRSGGWMQISSSASNLFGSLPQASGAVINTAKINLRGGAGADSGGGGSLQFSTQGDYDFASSAEFVSNTGAIDVSSGDSSTDFAAHAGSISFFSETKVHNSGALTANGGTGAGYAGGGYGGSIDLRSHGLTENSGPLRVNGGSGNAFGGSGGQINEYGQQVTNTGALSAAGGNATVQGGSGGHITLSTGSGATSNTGALLVTAGNGTPSGQSGTIFIDGAPAP